MSEHFIQLEWVRTGDSFGYEHYKRDHSIAFSKKVSLDCSSAPHFHGNPLYANPEQLFVASIASCHMLTFLALASKKQFVIDSYSDKAFAVLQLNAQKKNVVSTVVLNPVVEFSSDIIPTQEQFDELHLKAHHNCFIANSVRAVVAIEVKATYTRP